MALHRLAAVLVSVAVPFVTLSSAFAQPKPPPAQGPATAPPPAKAPPGTKTDLELDPDAKPPEPPPLPPAAPGQWGVGGKEEEGKFAPPSKKRDEDEQARKAREEEAKKPVDLGPPRAVTFDTVVAFGDLRDVANNKTVTSAMGASFIAGFHWRIFDIWTVGARFPFSRVKVDGPAGQFDTVSVGNLEFLVRPSFKLTRELRLPAQLSVFVPTAQGDLFPDQTNADKNVPIAQAQVNQAASWSRGWEEMPLFATKRLGLRFGAGITWDHGAFHVAAGTKLDLMVKTGGGEAWQGFSVTGTSLAWVTNASFFYSFLDGKLEPGLRAWLAYAKLPITTPAVDDSGAQLVLEPAVNGRFPVNAAKTMAVKAGLGMIIPVKGPLGGSGAPIFAAVYGLRVNAAFEF